LLSTRKAANAYALLSSASAFGWKNVVIFSMLSGRSTAADRMAAHAASAGSGLGISDAAHCRWDAVRLAPQYIDYLFLAYNTATAFSPTDAVPYTHRAKMLMTLESAISLVTLVVVLSRAINVSPNLT
jgi:hypothetical protein